MRAIAALARADLLERVRRYSFLVTLGFVLWLGAGTFDGSVSVRVADAQGEPNAAWIGGMMALVATTFLTLAGFWVVKNAVERDERTGVGPILATTPLTRLEYVLGKALSHFLVLLAMVGVLVLCALALLVVRGSVAGAAGTAAGGFDAIALLAPFVLCVVPALALTAALALLFETTPLLRGGAGNAIWFFFWGLVVVVAMTRRDPYADPLGILLIQHSMGAAAQAQLGVDPGSLTVSLEPGQAGRAWRTFLWHGVAWTPGLVLARLAWLAAAVGIAAAAAIPFHRFDPSRRRFAALRPRRKRGAAEAKPRRAAAGWLRFLPGGIVGSELRLLLAGAGRWWSVVAAGLFVAGWLAPLPIARSGVLLAAWLWPLLRWSQLGARDAVHGTEAFVLTAPRSLGRQLPAAWLAGGLLAAALGLGVGVRLALSGDGAGFLAWGAAVLFIPAFALALGLLSRGTKLFEVLYTLLWYAGPANRVPGLDFIGATPATARPATWLAVTAVLLAVAAVVRARQLRG